MVMLVEFEGALPLERRTVLLDGVALNIVDAAADAADGVMVMLFAAVNEAGFAFVHRETVPSSSRSSSVRYTARDGSVNPIGCKPFYKDGGGATKLEAM